MISVRFNKQLKIKNYRSKWINQQECSKICLEFGDLKIMLSKIKLKERKLQRKYKNNGKDIKKESIL